MWVNPSDYRRLPMKLRLPRRAQWLTGIVTAGLIALMTFSAFAATYAGKVNADKVLLRKKANATCDYYARLPKGAQVTILDTSGDYYKVQSGAYTGYILKKYVSTSSAAASKLSTPKQQESKSKYAKVTTIKGLGEAPGNLQYGDQGTGVEKLQRALQLKKCYDGAIDGKFGNMTVEALKKYQGKNNLTQSGKADSATIKKLFGMVSETSRKDDPAMKGITSISQLKTPNTTRKGSTGQHVKTLQQALKLKGFFTAPIDSSYGDVTAAAVKSYQKSCGLKQDGIAGNDVIKRLFGNNAPNFTYKTERLDWFAEGSSTIPKGAVFTVKDIGSGIVFTMRRWSGVNHLDAEPANESSTEKLKKAYGGAWSWSRRPVLVKYNGHVYAGSMNGMPHGDDTVSGNDFKGHVCIHFYKSKTHGTARVDQAHQDCVSRAMNVTW